MTLTDLAELIGSEVAADKNDLPLLKLARYGDERSTSGSIRTNHNTKACNGIEGDHDSGMMDYDEAVGLLAAANVEVLIHTSRSYVPGEKEKWRVLFPTSKELPIEERTALVERANAILLGELERESFTPWSQSFFYGHVEGAPHRETILRGRYIDECTEIAGEPYIPGENEAKMPGGSGAAHGYSEEELAALLQRSRIRKHGRTSKGEWHPSMLAYTAARVNQGWSDRAIFDATEDFCDRGWGDDDLAVMIKGAREKFGRPDPEPVMSGIAPLLVKLKADYRTKKTVFDAPGDKPRKEAEAGAPPMPPDDASHNERVDWLLGSFGYCMVTDKVVDLYQTLLSECEVTPSAFDRRFMAWNAPTLTAAGNPSVRIQLATHNWALAKHRVHVQGCRMNPEESFPLYREDGRVWKNSYRRPRHEGAEKGDILPLLRFMERFLPDAREREWFWNCMAHKWMRPGIPGTCVLFVADDDEDEDAVREGKFGTGRGTLFKIARKLYGPEYVRAQRFSILDGSSGQSTYNDWLHGAVLTTVNEAQVSTTAHRRGTRKSIYEVLKDIVDPAPTRHTFSVKYGRGFEGWTYCSIWLASNHADALAIPAKDRRFTILTNGRIMTKGEIKEIVAWMERPENIAVLAQFLEARDLSEFDMFQPLETRGKQAMVDMSATLVDETMTELMGDDDRGLVFTRRQLEQAVENIVSPADSYGRRAGNGHWQGDFKAAWSVYCIGLKTKNGTHWKIREHGEKGGRQIKLYCFRVRKRQAEKLPEAARRAQAAKWGGLSLGEDVLKGIQGGLGTQPKD